MSHYCSPVGLSIINNSELYDASALVNVEPRAYVYEECKIQILNNPKLDISHLCETEFYKRLLKIEVYNNLKDCGCRGGQITLENAKSFKKCIGLFNGLKMFNMSYDDRLNSLSKIEVIKGNVEIAYTNLTDLSFFKKLIKIGGQTFYSPETVIWNIHDNPNMKKLGLNWKKVQYFVQKVDAGPEVSMNLENLHPDFCLTYQEARVLFSVRFKNLQAKFCENQDLSEFPPNEFEFEKRCNFTSVKELEENCTVIFGDVLIDYSDEEYVYKLKSLNDIFGSLTVQNTELEDLNFLGELHRIYNLHDTQPSILIFNNLKMEKIKLPQFYGMFAKGHKSVVIANNSPNLFRLSRQCLAFQHRIHGNVTFNGKNCKAIDEVNQGCRFSALGVLLWSIILHFC